MKLKDKINQLNQYEEINQYEQNELKNAVKEDFVLSEYAGELNLDVASIRESIIMAYKEMLKTL